MTKRYSIAQARANLPTIVDEVLAGGEIELTRRGEPVAVVLSLRAYGRLRSQRPRFADVYRAYRERVGDAEVEGGEFAHVRALDAGRRVDL